MRRLFVLGLDSAPPRVIYDGYGVETPTLSSLVGDGERYVMRSCHPPITVPAWMVLFTGKSPGELGIYGFRHRRPGDVRESYIVNSTFIKHETIWEWAGARGLRSGIVGVPPTYPPRPIRGFMVTDFTTPGPEKRYTFPPWLKGEIESEFGPPTFDVTYRSDEKGKVAKEILDMTRQHLAIVEGLMTRKRWDMFIYVEIGVDRVHHAFWRYFDEGHPRYEEHPEYSRVIPEFYGIIDGWLERMIPKLPSDVVVAILSDHGAKAMKGAFAMNQWLEREGYLKFKDGPRRPGQDLSADMIDWTRTRAWAWGGYYSRLFVNLEGREPMGIVKEGEYDDLIEQLKADIEGIRGPDGERWENSAYRPEELYPSVNGDPPDLIVYLDDLNWRPAGTIGWPSEYLEENDRGPDDMVHDWNGVLTIYDPEGSRRKGDVGTVEATGVRGLLEDVIGS